MSNQCRAVECPRNQAVKGLCYRHYSRLRKTGSLDIITIKGMDTWQKVFDFYTTARGQGCWLWEGNITSGGYGRAVLKGQKVIAHRMSYAIHKNQGVFPPSTEHVDHRCRNTSCVNPEHLRLSSPKQNNENRGIASNNTSGYRGVHWNKRRSKWVATVTHNKKSYSKMFDDKLVAAEWARLKRLELFTHNDEDKTVLDWLSKES